MATRLAEAATATLAEQRNRRVYVRMPCGPATSSQVTAGPSRPRRAEIQDISLGGVALVLRQAIRVGTMVLIQLKNETLGLTYDLSASVMHTTRRERHRWIIGCQFARALSQPELETLL